MQIQEIIAYFIVAFACCYVLVSLYKTLLPSKKMMNQNGCVSNCNCDAKAIRKELMIKSKVIKN
jgi:hypothetical protein